MAYLFAHVSQNKPDGSIEFKTADGKIIALTSARLKEIGCKALPVNSRVRLTTQGERITKVALVNTALVAAAGSSQGRNETSSSQSDSNPPSNDHWQNGTVAEISAYRGQVKGEHDQMYTFLRAQFKHLPLTVGDQVMFCFADGSYEITAMRLIRQHVEGVGGMDPCNGDMEDLLADAGSDAIKQLVRNLCRERRLAWYWRTPATADESIPASERLSPELIHILRYENSRFNRLYAHQANALDALRQGQHVMVLTPTASGKTNCYNPAIFESLLGDPAATALYVFPLNALMNDQLDKLKKLAAGAKELKHDICIQMLQGGMKDEQQGVINGTIHPQIIATNPELLSYLLTKNGAVGIKAFLHGLRYVVLDEAHFFRGLFGLHMAGIMRRLRLACDRYGNNQPGPQFILSSATVREPVELATRLTGIDAEKFHIITKEKNGRAQPQRHWLMLDPMAGDDKQIYTSHLHQAVEALADVLTVETSRPLKAIVFVRSFRELRWTLNQAKRQLQDRRRPDLANRIGQYASGLMSKGERESVFTEFKKEDGLRALISTNALEAGIDVGDLDVCILAGFPSHVMQMRQMAGRAGRADEGAVIFIPRLTSVIDHFYADAPLRLLSQPEESFVIDADNPYVTRRHLVAAASSMQGGVARDELNLFGRHTDLIIADAQQAGILERSSFGWTARECRTGPWAVERIRGREQEPWAICKAKVDERHCVEKGCLAAEMNKRDDSVEKCRYLVQLLDKQYVYREAHPGAIFESTDGDYYRCDLLDEKNHLVYATELANDTLMRTFPLEEIDVKFLDELGRRSLTRGAQLVWGRAKVTHWYTGYGEYQLIPRRRCRKCGISFASTVERCSECGQRPRPFMDQSDPEYFEFPHPYRVVLETIACRLELPATMEPALKTIALCPISHAGNKVHEFLVAGTPFQNSQELARLSGLGNDASAAAFDYYKQWQPKAEAWQKDHNHSTSFPGVYGQCLCYALREKLPEAPALEAFQKLTGYPATTDKRHICRKCYEGVLLPAAHTLEHVVVRRYPMVALGDSQDISSITYAIHPYTGMTTVVWYDQYEGGIGAAEKIFTQFEGLVQNTHDLLACDCQLDTGCVQCVQLPACDRDNHSLSKVGAAGLTNLLLGMDPFIPEQSFHKRAKKAHDEEDQAEQARHRERAAHDVPRPDTQEQPSGVDPFALMRVQSYVHDVVLAKSIEIRGEEITGELPPISIAVLQQAYQQIKAQERPTEWRCDPSWDAWHTLHILDSASLRMARAARNTIAMVIHPDHYDGDKAEATRMMQIVNAAWEKIKDARS